MYLSGEIHTDRREQIERGAEAGGMDITFTAPVTDHSASDAAGDHLGEAAGQFWRDHQSAKVSAIRTRTRIERSDLVVVRFADDYKPWNAPSMQVTALPWQVLHHPARCRGGPSARRGRRRGAGYRSTLEPNADAYAVLVYQRRPLQ